MRTGTRPASTIGCPLPFGRALAACIPGLAGAAGEGVDAGSLRVDLRRQRLRDLVRRYLAHERVHRDDHVRPVERSSPSGRPDRFAEGGRVCAVGVASVNAPWPPVHRRSEARPPFGDRADLWVMSQVGTDQHQTTSRVIAKTIQAQDRKIPEPGRRRSDRRGTQQHADDRDQRRDRGELVPCYRTYSLRVSDDLGSSVWTFSTVVMGRSTQGHHSVGPPVGTDGLVDLPLQADPVRLPALLLPPRCRCDQYGFLHWVSKASAVSLFQLAAKGDSTA